MIRLTGMRGTGLVALGLSAIIAAPAQSADFSFSSVSDEQIDWADPDNWTSPTPGSLPGIGDDATIVGGLLRGAEVHDTRSVNSLVLDSGLNVYRSGTLTVVNGITANAGYFINDGVVISDIVNNTYISNTHTFFGDVVNNAGGSIINDRNGDDAPGVWTGDIVDNASEITNHGTWNGKILINTGRIFNERGATWNGEVVSNTGEIVSLDSIWIGDITSSGIFQLTGTATGSITNSGTLAVTGLLSGVTSIENTGSIGLDDGDAGGRLGAQSWSGTGQAIFDFESATGRADRIELSGDYDADTEVRIVHVGPAGRSLGDVTLVTVGGANTGNFTPADMPEDGIISYRLVRSGNDWIIAASLNDAPAHVAAALSIVDAALGNATRTQTNAAGSCGDGAWIGGLGGRASGAAMADTQTVIGFGGVQIGYRYACVPVLNGATLGIGITAGTVMGSVDQSTAGDDLHGDFQQVFAGLTADFIDGAFRAIAEAQAAGTRYHVSDPGSLLDGATLFGMRSTVSGTASYTVSLGGVRFVPELGLAVSARHAGSRDFSDVGTMRLASGPEVAAHAGFTLSADLALAGDMTLTPFVSAMLNGDLIAPSARFIDGAGNSAALPIDGLGPYFALAFGADLIHAGTVDAGLRADFKLGAKISDMSLGAHAHVQF